MILQDKAKEDFLTWYFKAHHRSLNYNVIKESESEMFFMSLHKVFQTALITEWLDSVGIYITIESYLGGGGVVFYPQIEYRNESHIDVFDCLKWDDGFQWYSTSRQEATKAAIEKANEIYNTQHFAP